MYQFQYTLDLTKIDGEGDFCCPRCGINISPEDDTEKTYRLIETNFENGGLKEIALECNNCGSCIHLKGFEKFDTNL
ncbi:MAG: hypothetical protein V1915_02060 [Candidatus Bathyarchaeota archaeon]